MWDNRAELIMQKDFPGGISETKEHNNEQAEICLKIKTGI